MQHGDLPEGSVSQRITEEFDAASVPTGLLRAHRLARGVWGLLRVTGGSLVFVREGDDPLRVELREGDSLVIAPGVPHHVELTSATRFRVEFYR